MEGGWSYWLDIRGFSGECGNVVIQGDVFTTKRGSITFDNDVIKCLTKMFHRVLEQVFDDFIDT